MFRAFRASLTAALLAASACTHTPDPAFNELARFDRQSSDQRIKLTLPFDSYVVGVEKGRRSFVGAVAGCPADDVSGECLSIDAEYFAGMPELRDMLRTKYRDQERLTFVSHVARFDGGSSPCFVFNRHDAAIPCGPIDATPDGVTPASQGFAALRRLGDDLDRWLDRRPTSHVVVYTMGWNTKQIEALDNFRRLIEQLAAAAVEAGDTDFRPLVIGMTWPSTGFPTIPMVDYGIKAGDADEVGAIWQNLLLNRELRRLKSRHKFRLIVVGHSFGARLSSRAVFSAPLVGAPEDPVVDLLVGLQGAYSFQRFLADEDCNGPEGREGAPYRHHARQAGLVALTSSRSDSAVRRAGHARYFVGSSDVYERTQSDELRKRFAHAVADADGRLPTAPDCDPRRVLMIDASAAISGNEPGTGGGSHSMIYTKEVGRLTHQLIRSCAP